jgi:integrase/recombinase XerD
MPARVIKSIDGNIRVVFAFNKKHIEMIKKIQGRKWDPSLKCWILPHTNAVINELRSIFGINNLIIDTGIENYVQESKRKNRHYDFELVENELKLKGFSHKTIKVYLGHIKRFVEHYCKSPENLGTVEVRQYLVKLINEDKSSHSYVQQALSSLKFLYNSILKNDEEINDIPFPKREQKLPNVLSQNEVKNILCSISNKKHRAILFMVYSSGLRVGEVVNLKLCDIDYDRMLVKVCQGKGKKDRVSILSKTALEVLDVYKKEYKPDYWLFPGQIPQNHITEGQSRRFLRMHVKRLQ